MGAASASCVPRLLRWGVVGVTATLSYAFLAWVLAKEAGLPAGAASVVAYGLSAGISYVGHRHLTFRSSRPHREALSPFVGISLLGYAAAFLIPVVVTGVLGAPVEASILATCATVPALTYLGLSRLVFRTSR